MRFINLFFSITFLALCLTSCEKDNNGGKSDDSGNFDRKAMLRNTGSNIIIPNYKTFNQKAKALHQAGKQFTSNTSSSNFSALRSSFMEAYKAWQYVTPYGFGPAKQMALRNNLNTFPADSGAIEKRIKNDNQNWGPYDNASKGFPALDYMLYKYDDQQQVLAMFTDSANAQNRKSYLKAVTKEIKQMSENVLNEWQASGGNYIETFINATGNDKGSSLALLVNQLNFDYEIIKNDKLGIPLGKKSLGNPFPKKVEAYYSGNSIELMLDNMTAIENLFLGKYGQNNKKGIDDHLDAVDAKRGGKKLSVVIQDQFDKARNKLNGLPQPLSESIQSDKSRVDEAYNTVQKQVVFLKTDMPAALGVRITYQDNDGD